MSDLKNPVAQARSRSALAAAAQQVDQARAQAQAQMPVPLSARLPAAGEVSAAAAGGSSLRAVADGETWRDRLVTARWRGMYFLTDGHEAKGGWRLAIHQFPGGDSPLVENLGAAAPGWQLSAYFIGAGYDLARDAFLGLLNTPGAAWLQHPWLGMLWVHPQSWAVSESNERQGHAQVSVQFVPGGVEPGEPMPDVQAQARKARAAFQTAAVEGFALEPLPSGAFETMVAGVQGGLEQLRKLVSMSTMPLIYANASIALVQDLQGNLEALLDVPGQYAAALDSMVNSIASLGQIDTTDLGISRRRLGGEQATVRNVTQVAAQGRAAQAQAAATMTGQAGDTGSALALRSNLAAEAGLRAQLLVAAAAELALADYASAEDRDTAQAAVVGAIDALLPTLPDALFQAALETRTALIAALQAQDLAPTQTRALVASLPSVVLAQRMGVDEDMLLSRNAVRHPLFVQGAVHA